MLEGLLFTDVMRNVVCSDDEFAFTGKNRKVFARLNRAELGDTECLILEPFLLALSGTSYFARCGLLPTRLPRKPHSGRAAHCRRKLPGGTPAKDKTASGTTMQDAEALAEFEGHVPGRVGFTDFVQGATS